MRGGDKIVLKKKKKEGNRLGFKQMSGQQEVRVRAVPTVSLHTHSSRPRFIVCVSENHG